MKHVEYAYTRGLEDEEVDDLLRTTETGVLALAADDDAYAVPMAHYYDGDGLYFRLGRTEGSEKWAFIDQTKTACYTIYGTRDTEDADELKSWSITATGTLSELPASEREVFDTEEINQDFPPIRIFGESVEDVEIVVLEFEIETMTGRMTLP